MKGSITLHKKLGLNPRMMRCIRCGELTNEIALLGNRNRKYKCKNCGVIVCGGRGSDKCPSCGEMWCLEFYKELEDHEELPSICDKCRKLQSDVDAMVRDGGVYFKCKKCGSEGGFKKDHPLSGEVRKQLKVDPPKPCGVELEECPQCADKGGD